MGRKPLLTKEKVLVALQRWTARNGGQPSVEELRRELGVASTRTVFRYLQMLEDDGAIKRRPGAPGVKLLKPRAEGAQTRAVPVVGRVPAGALMLAEENIEGWIHLPKALASPASDKFFLLRVRGTSMNRAKVGGNTIDDGDLILVRQQPVARNGDIIVGDGRRRGNREDAGEGARLRHPEAGVEGQVAPANRGGPRLPRGREGDPRPQEGLRLVANGLRRTGNGLTAQQRSTKGEWRDRAMRIQMAHLRDQGINFAIFAADAANHTDTGRQALLAELVAKARGNRLRVDKAALAYRRQAAPDSSAPRISSNTWRRAASRRWTHTLDV